MRFSVFALVRLIVLTSFAAGIVAIGVARMEPHPSHFRVMIPPHYSVVNGFSISHFQKDLGFLDSMTGEFAPLVMPKEDRLEFGSFSPWLDDEGESQVVGRWIQEIGPGLSKHCAGIGLARYSLPSGRVLNRIPLDVMPSSYPCWFPGLSAKVLYSAADGRLYTVAFSDTTDEDEEPAPRVVSWRCPHPGSKVIIKDPVWPSDPRFGGRLIVSLSYQTTDVIPRITPSRLWWLALDREGTAIVEAGALAAPDGEEIADERTDERFPNLAATPSGDLVLTYLWQPLCKEKWRLRMSRLSSTATTPPAILRGTTRTVVDEHIPALAPFSADGRYVFCLVENERGEPIVSRVSTEPTAVESH